MSHSREKFTKTVKSIMKITVVTALVRMDMIIRKTAKHFFFTHFSCGKKIFCLKNKYISSCAFKLKYVI